MPRTKLTLLLLVTAANGCGTGGGAVKPDEMSAAQHRDEAARENDAAHARQHEKAAQALERFEAAECIAFPPVARAACPLLRRVSRIDDIGGGVRVTFAPGAPVHAVFAHMRCHYAFARARAFEEVVSCPLYVRGVEIKRATDPLAIDITHADGRQVDELRVRARQEAVYAGGSGP